jgi:hypothetical protein
MGERFDACCSHAAQIFMELPELPSRGIENGQTVTSFSNPYDAAQVVVSKLEFKDVLEVFYEIADRAIVREHHFDEIDSLESPSLRGFLAGVLVNLVADDLFARPDISARLQSNERTYDQI